MVFRALLAEAAVETVVAVMAVLAYGYNARGGRKGRGYCGG